MRRHIIQPRADWEAKVEADGLAWHTIDGKPYWTEGAYYAFTAAEIEWIETATAELYPLFLRAGEALVANKGDWLDRFGIPAWTHDAIRRSWEAEPPALNYGRFDFGLAPDGTPKLFEFNCDTPTSLLEASVVQWTWKEEVFPRADQFNSLHEKLVSKWKNLRPHLGGKPVYFASAMEPSGEDLVTVAYLRDTCEQAGLDTLPIRIDDIGIDARGRFLDLDDNEIAQVFKLYPWEWIVEEEYGRKVVDGTTLWIEPTWKMLWSNKAILAVLWALDPGNPYLLPAHLEAPIGDAYVRKPLLGREGANVSVVRAGQTLATSGGEYGGEGYVFQELLELREFDGAYPVIGSWIVDGEPAGMGIREDGLITGNRARFVPHIIDG